MNCCRMLTTRPAPEIALTRCCSVPSSDLRRLFRHCGWRVEREAVFKQFPTWSPVGWVLSVYWRLSSFEGFYFVSLIKDDTDASRYQIE